jgi:hypothetical protein
MRKFLEPLSPVKTGPIQFGADKPGLFIDGPTAKRWHDDLRKCFKIDLELLEQLVLLLEIK